MGFTDGLMTIWQGVAGTVEKAKIKIADERPADGEGTPEPGAGRRAGGGGSSKFGVNADVQALANVADSVGDAVQSATGVDLPGAIGGSVAYNREFVVQFNPSTIHISAYAESETLKQDFSSKDANELSATKMEMQMHLDVQLIFDQVSPRMAFMEDMINISLSSVAKSIAAEVAGLIYSKNRQNNSVQTQVEGFIAATRCSKTKKIGFYWGDMAYDGVLRNVNARYTMFDLLGRPVRATVGLSIFLVDPNTPTTSGNHWYKAYQNLFNNPKLLESTFKKASGVVGALE